MLQTLRENARRIAGVAALGAGLSLLPMTFQQSKDTSNPGKTSLDEMIGFTTAEAGTTYVPDDATSLQVALNLEQQHPYDPEHHIIIRDGTVLVGDDARLVFDPYGTPDWHLALHGEEGGTAILMPDASGGSALITIGHATNAEVYSLTILNDQFSAVAGIRVQDYAEPYIHDVVVVNVSTAASLVRGAGTWRDNEFLGFDNAGFSFSREECTPVVRGGAAIHDSIPSRYQEFLMRGSLRSGGNPITLANGANPDVDSLYAPPPPGGDRSFGYVILNATPNVFESDAIDFGSGIDCSNYDQLVFGPHNITTFFSDGEFFDCSSSSVNPVYNVLDGRLKTAPNPFNASTSISYQLNQSADARLAIFDVTGRRVMNLGLGHQSPGDYQFRWDGSTPSGEKVGAGIYPYQLSLDDRVADDGKLVIVR